MPKIDRARRDRDKRIALLNEAIIATYDFLDRFKREKERLEFLNQNPQLRLREKVSQ